MKILDKINGIALCLAFSFMTGLVVSCDSIDDPDTYDESRTLHAPTQLIVTDVTTSSLSFSWDKVADAVQYGYTLCDASGKNVAGGTTNETSVTISGLDIYTLYTLNVTALPKIGEGMAVSAPSSIEKRTNFYTVVSEEECLYTSYLRESIIGHTYSGIIDEDRSYNGWKDDWFGYFTIKGFYGSKGDMTFKVNNDYTITILNNDYTELSQDDYDDNGWAKVATGYAMPPNLKTLFVEESSSVFDPENGSLTFTAKLSNSEENTEIIRW